MKIPKGMSLSEGCTINLGAEYVGKEKMESLAKELSSALSTDPWLKKGVIQYGERSVVVKGDGLHIEAIFDGQFVEVTNDGALDRGPKQNVYNIMVSTIVGKRKN